jgi:hypothetical protein
MLKNLILIFVFVINVYNIHDYGWKPYTPGGIGINNFAGGTYGPRYQYEPTFKLDCGFGCTRYARASDFGTLNSRDLHYANDNKNYDYNNMNYDNDRNYNHDINLDPN